VPEGDTIFQTAAALRPLLIGQPVVAAHARVPGPQIHRVVGSRVTAIEPIGKHMLIRFDNGLTLHTHLRMTGTWHTYAPGEPWRMPRERARVVLEVPQRIVVCFNAPVAELLPDRAVALHPALRALGPDLLAIDFSETSPASGAADEALSRLRQRQDAEIAEALADQRVMAGVGNVFKSEVLFVEHVDPWARVGDLSDATLEALIATAHRLLQDNAIPGLVRRVTTRGDPSARGSLWVYGRANRPCARCGTSIRVRRQGQLNRPTYWCPTCQPSCVPPPPASSGTGPG
jgi:endonuclease-8